jgi:exodeoxyribonuclease III
MKIISWNVNGIRAAVRKGFADFLQSEKPDLVCLQEIKIADQAILKANFDFGGYDEFWHPAQRPGYSGTAILARKASGAAGFKIGLLHKGIGDRKFDMEGRSITAELPDFYLVNTYFPNANHALSRLQYKLEFNDRLLGYLKKLEKEKPVILCGDYNVAHDEIDLARPKENVGNPGFTDEEREWMTRFLSKGFIDTFRHMHPDKVQYSWWSQRFVSARAKNIGWRIDYFCVSESFLPRVKKSFIMDQVHGSDHCPVGIIVERKS